MATTTDIDKAIEEIRASDAPNIAQIARKYDIQYTKLWRRYKGIIKSMDAHVKSQRLLSPQQDQKLLDIVNRLTIDGLPPTAGTVRRLAKDLCGSLPGKNWPARWVQAHGDTLNSGYLKGFDLARKKADSFYQYRAYFELVMKLSTSTLSTDSSS